MWRPLLYSPLYRQLSLKFVFLRRILIDFSPKGGPKDLLGKYDEFGGVPGIVFPDGMTLIEHACLELLTPPTPCWCEVLMCVSNMKCCSSHAVHSRPQGTSGPRCP